MSNLDFRLRYQVRKDSPHGKLFKYLQSKETEFDTRQMVLWSLSGFWYPLACKWLNQHSEDQLKAIAQNAIYELQKQISYIACAFGLDKELAEAGSFNGVVHNSEGRTSVASEQFMATPSQNYGFSKDEEEPLPEPPELLHHPDDELLNQMIKGAS